MLQLHLVEPGGQLDPFVDVDGRPVKSLDRRLVIVSNMDMADLAIVHLVRGVQPEVMMRARVRLCVLRQRHLAQRAAAA